MAVWAFCLLQPKAVRHTQDQILKLQWKSLEAALHIIAGQLNEEFDSNNHDTNLGTHTDANANTNMFTNTNANTSTNT